MDLRDASLKAGIKESDFWTMTAGEAARACDAYWERMRDSAYLAYTNAMAVGMFIGSMFSKQPAPSIDKIYPEFFKSDEEKKAQERMAKSEVNFINFANAFNKRFEYGNREPKSEDNG